MMKKNSCFGMMTLAAAGLLLAGCKTDVLDEHLGEVPITLTTTVIESHGPMVTRAGADIQSTQLPSGATFAAEFTGSDVTVTSTVYQAGEQGSTTIASGYSQPYFKLSGSSTTVHAYHGKSGGASGTQVTSTTQEFTVATDQSQTEAGTANYKASDLMFATATVQKLLPTGALQFRHKMAKIIINATVGNGIGSITAVKIIGGSRTVNITDATTCALGDQLTDANSSDGTNITVFSGTHSEGTLSCAALLPPQTVTGTDFLLITTDQGDVIYNLDSKAFASGQSYTFNTIITAAAVGTTIAITDWAGSEDTTDLVNNGITQMFGDPKAVDLGLPSGTKWANMNVGATSETDYGLYFMWGDIVGYSGANDNGTATDGYSFDWSWSNYKWTNDGGSTFTRYTGSDFFVLHPVDDAATVNCGENWRMPTSTEEQELVNTFNDNDFGDNNSTNWKWEWQENYKGVSNCNGWLISYRASTDNTTVTSTLFLPAAGYREHMYVVGQGWEGHYWSSSLNYPSKASHMCIVAPMEMNDEYRFFGFTVRPVYDPPYVDLGLPSGTKWAKKNIGAISQSDRGTYFMWGDVVGHTGEHTGGTTGGTATDGFSFSWANYKWTNDGGNSFTKYTGSDFTELQPADDAATVYWGSNWRMPTKEEFEELISARLGWLAEGSTGQYFNGNHQNMFLPHTGYRYDYTISTPKWEGYYLTSTLYSDDPKSMWVFYMYMSNSSLQAGNIYRCRGCTVRPVYDPPTQ